MIAMASALEISYKPSRLPFQVMDSCQDKHVLFCESYGHFYKINFATADILYGIILNIDMNPNLDINPAKSSCLLCINNLERDKYNNKIYIYIRNLLF